MHIELDELAEQTGIRLSDGDHIAREIYEQLSQEDDQVAVATALASDYAVHGRYLHAFYADTFGRLVEQRLEEEEHG